MAFDYRSPLGVTATQSNQPGVTTIHLPDLPRGLPQNSSLYFFCTKKEGAEIKFCAFLPLYTDDSLHDFFIIANIPSILYSTCLFTLKYFALRSQIVSFGSDS